VSTWFRFPESKSVYLKLSLLAFTVGSPTHLGRFGLRRPADEAMYVSKYHEELRDVSADSYQASIVL
jgi:hypothetical protein